MHELSTKWLSGASPIEHALAETETAHIYLGGPADARRMRDIPPEKFEANSLGGDGNPEPRRKRRGRGHAPPIGGPPPGGARTLGPPQEKRISGIEKAPPRGVKEGR